MTDGGMYKCGGVVSSLRRGEPVKEVGLLTCPPACRGLCRAGPDREEGRGRRAAPAEERRVLPHSGGPGGREGGRMVDVCLPRNKTNVVSVLYPVMFGLSALCLLVSNIFYLLLRRKTFLNNVMFHYTLMLLLAYSALILIQRPELWQVWLSNTIRRSVLRSLSRRGIL